jgi:glycosyltransferase involved in cell wall biosynthesis
MKKVLIITNLFPNKYNELAGIFVKLQADELAKDYEVRVVATSFPHKPGKNQVSYDGYDVINVYFPTINMVYLSSLIFYKHYAGKVISGVIQDWGPDIIHVHDCRHVPELICLHSILETNEIPQFLTVHNIRTHPERIRNHLSKWVYKHMLARAYTGYDCIFSVNSSLKDALSEFYPPEKIQVVGNAVNPIPRFDHKGFEAIHAVLPEQEFKIISVGNLKKEKGFDILIKAVHNLVKRDYNITIMIVGEGVEKVALEKLTSELELAGKVIFTGRLDNKFVRNVLRLFDAFVLPSYSETFGIAYLEAMDAELPVIGVVGQGVDGVIEDGVSGLLANPRDIEDLTAKIKQLIDDPGLAKSLAYEGKKLIEAKYRLVNLISKYKIVYNNYIKSMNHT